MAVLPDKILTEQKIAEFIDQTNINAKNIVGDSKFTIPDIFLLISRERFFYFLKKSFCFL